MYESRKLPQKDRIQRAKERIRKGYPAHAPPHPIRNAQHYLITAACFEHRPHMSILDRRHQLLQEWSNESHSHALEILAWVVLPNHYHFLIKVPDFEQLGKTIRVVHGRTARSWNLLDGLQGRKVWYRYTDRAIRSERHYYTTLNYIHYNPVKHGLATSPYAWEPSSLGWYLEHRGRDWLRDLWVRYPLKSYGEGWDGFDLKGS